jgi:hypothetical protein
VLVQVPHVITGTIVGYTTEDACTVDPAHPLKQGEKINCSFPNVPTYTCGARQCLNFTASAPPGWGFAGWEPCGFACQIVFPSPCAGTNTSPCTFETDGDSAAYDTADFTDTRAPDTTIVSGPPDGHVVISATRSEQSTFANTNEPAESPAFLCSLDDGAFAACPATYTLQAISDGIHTLAVDAKDASGLIGPAVRRRWEEETPPTADIVSGPAQGSTVGTPSAQFGSAPTSPRPPSPTGAGSTGRRSRRAPIRSPTQGWASERTPSISRPPSPRRSTAASPRPASRTGRGMCSSRSRQSAPA